MTTESYEKSFEIHPPTGRVLYTKAHAVTALPDLRGKTIGFVWDYMFKGDEMFAILADRLKSNYPDVRFVHHATFGNIHGDPISERENVANLASRLRQHGVDAAIVGVGA